MNKQRKNYNKWIYWGIGILMVVVVAGAGVVMARNNNEDEATSNAKTEEVETAETIEAETESDDTAVVDKVIEEKKVPQYEGDDPNEAEELTGVITYAGVIEDKLMIRVNIDQYLEDGDCLLSLRQEGMNVYSETVNIVGSASTSTCEGFDVPLNSIGVGNTQININISSGEREGVIEGEVSI